MIPGTPDCIQIRDGDLGTEVGHWVIIRPNFDQGELLADRDYYVRISLIQGDLVYFDLIGDPECTCPPARLAGLGHWPGCAWKHWKEHR